MLTLSTQELIEKLKNVKGTTFISFDSETEPKLLGGKSCPLLGIKKISRVNGAIGFNYQNAVNNQRGREGLEKDFESLPRVWGTRISGTPLVEHKNNFYLEVKVEKTETPHYFLNGERVDNEVVKQYLPKNKEGQRQELEKVVILRDYSVNSLKRIKINKEEYLVVN